MADLRDMVAAGRDHAEIAEEFDITDRHVRRLVRGDQRGDLAPAEGAVYAAVRRLLDGIELDDADEVLAASAEVLAVKLDALKVSESAASAAAAPALVRQLADVLREIRGEAEEIGETVRRMLEPLTRRSW